MQRIQKIFRGIQVLAKIKHETTCTDSENGGLKNVDIATKIIRLPCAWKKSSMIKASMTGN